MCRNVVLLFLSVVIIVSAGCGGGMCRVSGKVTFPDGTPVTKGDVLFDGKGHTAKGEIKSDGTYVMGLNSSRSGIPQGSYRVCIIGVNEKGPEIEMTSSGSMGGGGTMSISSYVSLIHSKYNGPETSGLTCEVKGKTVYDIVVEPAEY